MIAPTQNLDNFKHQLFGNLSDTQVTANKNHDQSGNPDDPIGVPLATVKIKTMGIVE